MSFPKSAQNVLYKLSRILYLPPHRLSSYYSSPLLSEVGEVKVKYNATSSPDEWKYVERLLPPLTVPVPKPKPVYLSEWRPQSNECLKENYFVERTKNHMIPVYLEIGQFGIRRITRIKNIKGDIWALEKELVEFLQKETPKPIRSQVNEFCGFIRIYGDFVNATKYWLMKKKF